MAKRYKVPLSKRMVRSAISNGRYILPEVDHRSPHMRRLRDLVADHISDLGGPDQISHSERILVSRASMLCLLTEMQEARFMDKPDKIPPTEFTSYLHAVGNLNRILLSLGLRRRPKDVTPSLQEYLRSKETGDGVDADE